MADQTADVADVDSVLVGHVHESLLQEAGRAVTDHAISLHLTESETSFSGSTFCRLSGQDLDWTSTSAMHLLTYHMLQSLVVCWAEEDQYSKLLTCKSVVHNFVSIPLVAQGMQPICDITDLLTTERCGVSQLSIERSFLR